MVIANVDSCVFPLQFQKAGNIQTGHNGCVAKKTIQSVPLDLPLVDEFHLDFPLSGLSCSRARFTGLGGFRAGQLALYTRNASKGTMVDIIKDYAVEDVVEITVEVGGWPRP